MLIQRWQKADPSEGLGLVAVSERVVARRQVVGGDEHHHQLAQLALEPHLQLRARRHALARSLCALLLLYTCATTQHSTTFIVIHRATVHLLRKSLLSFN